MRILVSGISGFIAPRVANLLINHKVLGIERYVTGRTLYQRDESFNRCFCDLNDFHGIKQIIKMFQPEIMLHLGALSPVSLSYNQPIITNQTNYMATINLAESCMQLVPNFKQFIFAGTSEEYGNQKIIPIKEDVLLKPNSPYAVSKVASNIYLEYMRDAYNFPITIVRPFNTYGRVGTTHFVTERIITQMLNKKKILRLGDPLPIRDMMYVDDHVDAYLSVLNNKKAIGETFNFCTGKGYTISEMVELISKNIGWRVRFYGILYLKDLLILMF